MAVTRTVKINASVQRTFLCKGLRLERGTVTCWIFGACPHE